MSRGLPCPVCSGVVAPLPYKREDPQVTLDRHMNIAHPKEKKS